MKDDHWLPDDEMKTPESLQRRTEELYNIPNTPLDEDGLVTLPVIPLRDLIIFPHMLSPLFIGRETSLLAVEEALGKSHTVIAVTQRDPAADAPAYKDLYDVGVELAVGQLLYMPDETTSTLVQGRRRVEIVEYIHMDPFIVARARPLPDQNEIDREMKATMRSVLDLFQRCVELNHSLPDEATLFAMNIDDPGWLADMVVTTLNIPLEERQSLLGETDALARLQRVSHLLTEEVGVLELEDEIHAKAQSEVSRGQREMYLREQMRVIQSELGEGDPWVRDIMELRAKVEAADLPDLPKDRALKEVERLSQMPPMSPEVGIIRTYVDWLLDLPWTQASEDNLDVTHAAEVLDSQHYGLPKAKDRILEFIAVKSLKPDNTRQPILCFVGPPGTGKTSLGKSIAAALGREFVRISLGGVRDEAEIRGHRRTYIGALPGRILQTMRRAKTTNPLFMLDEVDKLTSDFRGDPAAALLEVLDPEQNHAFSDHYLEIDYDLSNVMFITTANFRSHIPWALLDRMEVIGFPGYIEEEKIEIARRFLIPRQLEDGGLDEAELQFSEAALQRVIREYTYEAGVRNLEREIGKICRKVARAKAEKGDTLSRVGANAVEKYLGPPQFFNLEAEREDEVGLATSLAWTESGGDITPIEIATMEGKGNLQITGQVGNVMQESAQAAMSYLKARTKEFGLEADLFDETDVHIHVPEGAIPKDGPSAGITIATAIISAFTGRKVRKEVGMTGEITLRGRVLPVGGIREKVLAAHRAGLTTVIMPRKNLKDLVDVPKKARSDLNIVPVSHIDEVLEAALLPAKNKKKTVYWKTTIPQPPAKTGP